MHIFQKLFQGLIERHTNMFEKIRKYFALKSCINKLGPLLAKRYGKSKTYTPGQVETTSGVIGIDNKYLFYGYAMYCGQDMFYEQAKEANEEFDFEALRLEVGDKFFGGDSNFSTNDNHDIGGGIGDSGSSDIGGIGGMGGFGDGGGGGQ
jgi:hypothetical protein